MMAVSASTRRKVRARSANRCEYCHADETWQFVRFTIDHIIPQSDAGGDELENIALACRNCNERRSNRLESTDPETDAKVQVFNPREDIWNDHFSWSADQLHIVGVTFIGRATVRLLDMNDERHGERVIHVRRRDLTDGFHPPPGDKVLGVE